MNVYLSNGLLSFAVFSVLGWILEALYRSVRDGRVVNPGLLRGPYLPIYGTGAFALMACIPLIHEHNVLCKALCYFLITTGVELVFSMIGRRVSNVRLWDYSDERFQFRGHVCLKFSCYWVVLAFALEYLLLPFYRSLLDGLAPEIKGIVGAAVVLLMAVDFVFVAARSRFRVAAEPDAPGG